MKTKIINKFIGQAVAISIAAACSFILCRAEISAQQNSIINQLTDFRGFNWGSSIENVRRNEDAFFTQSFEGFGKYVLSFNGEYFERRASINYTFVMDSLKQGSYVFEMDLDEFVEEFKDIQLRLKQLYGSPRFRSGPLITSDSLWIPVTLYNTFRGPQLYWKFDNGFIGIISERDEDEVSITVLFVGNRSIEEYLNERTADIEEFDIIE
ncbi:hypothetical protein ACFLR4_04790 [Bacteroidota bacterium]